MRVAVSSCLLGIACKYNGGHNYNKKLVECLKGHEVISLCPEVLGGLPVPRESCEIVDGEVRTYSGESRQEAYQRGAERALAIVRQQQAELVILQSRSPSCGVCHIYDGTFRSVQIKGSGLFARQLRHAGIPALDMEQKKEIFRILQKQEN